VATTRDVSPVSILYAGFNNGVVTADSVRVGTNAIFAPNGRIGEGRQRRIH
jgi:acetyltransferase-like isoleucine patch superfamily enzyme